MVSVEPRPLYLHTSPRDVAVQRFINDVFTTVKTSDLTIRSKVSAKMAVLWVVVPCSQADDGGGKDL